MSQQGKYFKQRYYRNINTLSFYRPVLISGNVQSEYFAAVESFQTTILSNFDILILCRPVLLSGNFQSEHVTAVKNFHTTILSEL